MKIAVVGSGAAGASAFWALNEHSEHEVYLYEKEDRLGGHANAITVQVPGKEPCSVDTAFIMLNKEGYPTFWSFLDRLKIPLVKTDTSFSVSQGDQAWGSSFNGLFATPGSALKPRLWRMIFDLIRFHYACLDLLKPEVDESMSVGEYLDKNKYGDGFREDYLLPLAATFWSLPPERVVRECPIKTLVRNFHNHGLLQLWSRFTWYTIAGGSRSYIDRIVQNVPSERIRLSTPIQSMTKTDHGIELIEGDGATNIFDHVIMATHADTTLRILQQGNLLTARDEKSLLGACDWSQFEIVMHHDESAMPANKGVWSAWNTLLPDTDRGLLSPNPQDDSVSCTFDMNLLHAIPADKHGRIFGTLNPPEPIDSTKVFGRFSYSTPIFTTRLIDAQRQLNATADARFASGLSLVGAWMGLGTHEDAWEGGIAAARSLGADVCLTKRGKDRDVLESKVDWVIKWVLIVMGMLIAELEVLLAVLREKSVRWAKDF